MNCSKCSNIIELKTDKNPETGMYRNYWWCEEHGKVDPSPMCSETDCMTSDDIVDHYNKIYEKLQEQMLKNAGIWNGKS